jgi:hypothetical protein
MKSWGSGQARKFAGQAELGKTYYTIREQSAHARTYGVAQTVNEHVFTHRSLVTGQAMTEGRTSALQLCRTQGPVYDSRPRVEGPDHESAAKDFQKRYRKTFGGKR